MDKMLLRLVKASLLNMRAFSFAKPYIFSKSGEKKQICFFKVIKS